MKIINLYVKVGQNSPYIYITTIDYTECENVVKTFSHSNYKNFLVVSENETIVMEGEIEIYKFFSWRYNKTIMFTVANCFQAKLHSSLQHVTAQIIGFNGETKELPSFLGRNNRKTTGIVN